MEGFTVVTLARIIDEDLQISINNGVLLEPRPISLRDGCFPSDWDIKARY